ncbi:MAG: sigma-70 family RNA polymerase sigma factor [Oscillospiraceae bacterium]|nr:sigma-70 family RNA polymerase sigma factor [Oscillospiraceae bacterium]
MQPMEEIYQSYARTVYRYLLSLTRDDDLAEELTQETFFQAIRTSDRFDGSCAVSTWLCAIAKNVLSTYRRKHPPLADIEEQAIPTASAEDDALDTLGQEAMLRRLHEQPEPYREVLYLRILGDLPFRTIGEIFGRTENWARVTFYRGKERLRKDVQTHEQNPL